MSSPRVTPAEPLTPNSTRVPGSFPTDPISPGQQAQRNLAREVFERRDEYVKTSKFKIKIGSWNVAALPGTTKDLGAWFAKGQGISQRLGGVGTKQDGVTTQEHQRVESVKDQEKRRTPLEPTVPLHDPPSGIPGDNDIDIYALGLQEIVDVNSAAQALRPFNDPHPSRLWKEAVSEALPKDYVFIAEQQLVGLLLLIYASPGIAKMISSVSATYVGTGVMGYMGNKGAVAIRLVLGEKTKLVFINSHLAAGSDKASLDRRNWDFGQIMQRVQFDPIDHGYGMVEEVSDSIGDEDFAFWFGDLNYRLGSIPGDDVRRLLLLHTRNEYDDNQREEASLKRVDHELRINKKDLDHDRESTSTKVPSDAGSDASSLTDYEDRLDPSEDPASLQTTISSLLPHDQLHEQMRLQKAFSEGWREGSIKFLPTYKYDVGSVGMFDSSEKKRAPSWCDRILFRTRKDFVDYQRQKREQHEAEKRDKEMKARGLENGGDEVIFDYDPETDGGDDDEDEDDFGGNNGAEDDVAGSSIHDRLQLDVYTSHQRVLSSDHKPLDAVFSVEYDAVDPERKAMVHQEVAREIDRAENEARPAVSIVFDNNTPTKAQGDGCYFGDLRFREQKSVAMIMANTSPVIATFSFLAKEGLESTPSWLSLVFHHEISKDTINKKPTLDLTLEPGESSSVDVVAQVVHPSDVAAFNAGTSQPDDILILRVRNGRDHFIPVQAHWLRTCFGLSLDALVRLPASGARTRPPPPSSSHSNNGNNHDSDSSIRWSAPRELFRLTEALEENLISALASQNAYSLHELSQPGWPFMHFTQPPNDSSYPAFESQYATTLLSLRDSLDTNAPLTFPTDLPATTKTALLAQTLILFLTCMPGRLIPSDLWSTLSSSLAAQERSKRPPLAGEDLRAHILDVLSTSPLRSVSFTFVTFMLQRIVAQLADVAAEVQEMKDKDSKTGVLSSPLSPKSPEALLKRARGMSLSVDPRAVRRREIEKVFEEVFLGLVFEEEGAGEKGKGGAVMVSAKVRRAEMERKRIVLEAFLRGREDGG